MKKKALVLVQGISNKNNYIEDSLLESDFLLDDYDKWVTAKTEKALDGLFEKFTFGVTSFIGIVDTFGDPFRYLFSKKHRKAACRAVNSEVKKLTAQGYEVDILAHSLGTIIALTSGTAKSAINVNTFYSFGSPLGSTIFPWLFRRHVQKYIYGINIKTLYYCWNSKDFVSKKPLNQRFVNSLFLHVGKFLDFHISSGHSLLSYLNSFTGII
ncbi:hypothetical protein [Prochlorococcus sp. ALOHA_ZT_50]|uniref:hypothetical protein n=1 Tax=Prochlorococcus sp. ALOHA_ZT_50 TaxID=2919303 RepID=UPI0025801A59|nr:hypothetical protein [Prochlorococcus sp. ALOHA_ZT_50]MCH2079643.1 hypothetical protein [Prochlorococcus sp. ALOHA_ZT_50]